MVEAQVEMFICFQTLVFDILDVNKSGKQIIDKCFTWMCNSSSCFTQTPLMKTNCHKIQSTQ